MNNFTNINNKILEKFWQNYYKIFLIKALTAESFTISLRIKFMLFFISFSYSSQLSNGWNVNRSEREIFRAIEILTRLSGVGKYFPLSIELILFISTSTAYASFSCVSLLSLRYFWIFLPKFSFKFILILSF